MLIELAVDHALATHFSISVLAKGDLKKEIGIFLKNLKLFSEKFIIRLE